MWIDDNTKQKVDIVSVSDNWKQVSSISFICFKLSFSKMTHHQIHQLMWYLQNHPINPLGVEDVTKLMNFLISHNIHFNIHYRLMKTEKLFIKCNVAMFFKWFLPMKIQWYKVMFRLWKMRRAY